MTQAIPRAPRGLSGRSKALWASILTDFDLSEPEQAILIEALRSLDRADEARGIVDRDGQVSADRFGQLKPHPCIAVERDMRGLFTRTLRELGLDPRILEAARPPAIAGRYDA